MLHKGYPQSLQSSPLVLYHPVFANFIDDCESVELEHDSHIMVSQFTEAMTKTYVDEFGLQEAFRELCHKLLGIDFCLGQIAGIHSTYPMDGCIYATSQYIPVILKAKFNQNVSSVYKQACRYFWRWIETLGDHARHTRLPCLILCLNSEYHLVMFLYLVQS